MFKLDNNFLTELGLGTLPAVEKNKMLAHIYETLEMRVGMKLAEQMSNEQLDEFESYINKQDEAGALKWLESNFPNYKQVVAEELEKLKSEIALVAPQIVAQAAQNAAQQPQVPQGSTPQQLPQSPNLNPQSVPQPQQAQVVPQYPPVQQPQEPLPAQPQQPPAIQQVQEPAQNPASPQPQPQPAQQPQQYSQEPFTQQPVESPHSQSPQPELVDNSNDSPILDPEEVKQKPVETPQYQQPQPQYQPPAQPYTPPQQ